jgi:hypothetical protein
LQSRWFEHHGAPFSGDDAAHRFQTLVLYLFGSLAYYIGLSLRDACTNDPNRDYTPVNVVLAGNGSQYMHWLTDLARVDIAEFGRALGRLMLAGMGKPNTATSPRVSLTTQPKREVALGLVAGANIQGVGGMTDTRGSVAGESFKAKVGDQRREVLFSPSVALQPSDILFADQVAALEWSDGEMEIEKFHVAFARELEGLVGYGQQWAKNAQAIGELFRGFTRRELQQITRARLQLVSSTIGGFQGSLFVAEASAVAARIQDEFFGTVATPARGTAAVAHR